VLYDAESAVRNNTIMMNTAQDAGGGLASLLGQVMLDGNTIASNTTLDSDSSGGGLAFDRTTGTLRNNTIIDNQAGSFGGAFVVLNSNLDMINNIIADNSLTEADGLGAGIHVRISILDMWHNTLARNMGGDGSGITVEELLARSSAASNRGFAPEGPDNVITQIVSPTVNMTNTILMSHTIGITVSEGLTATLDHTLWGADEWANLTNIGGAGTISSTNAITGTPDFVDPASSDYHIGENSAALDAGIDAGITTDIDGDPRPLEEGFDIGADEFQLLFEIYLPFIAK
jgi:hypothetical protein